MSISSYLSATRTLVESQDIIGFNKLVSTLNDADLLKKITTEILKLTLGQGHRELFSPYLQAILANEAISKTLVIILFVQEACMLEGDKLKVDIGISNALDAISDFDNALCSKNFIKNITRNASRETLFKLKKIGFNFNGSEGYFLYILLVMTLSNDLPITEHDIVDLGYNPSTTRKQVLAQFASLYESFPETNSQNEELSQLFSTLRFLKQNGLQGVNKKSIIMLMDAFDTDPMGYLDMAKDNEAGIVMELLAE